MKILSRRTLLIAVLMGFALSSILLFYFVTKGSILSNSVLIIKDSESNRTIENAVVLPTQEQASTGLPMRLKIPSINVDTPVEYVALTPEGAMDAPKERANAAWFNLGPRPGENGSAVIAGHYGLKNGKGSVFDDLHKLREGDTIYIEDDEGVAILFVVRKSRRYDPEEDASDVFGSNDGLAHLNLVTCEGAWDEASKTYSKRLVVFTDKVDSASLPQE